MFAEKTKPLGMELQLLPHSSGLILWKKVSVGH